MPLNKQEREILRKSVSQKSLCKKTQIFLGKLLKFMKFMKLNL